MFDAELMKRKLSLNERELLRLREFEHLTIDEIAKNPIDYAAVERFLERLIGRAIDINRHIIAELGDSANSVVRQRDTFLRLADLGVYPEEFANSIAPSAGLRNALVHEYNNIDPAMLQKSIGTAIKEYNEYAKYILAFLENRRTEK